MLGWTQQEIGEKVGLSQKQISNISNSADVGKITKELQTYLSQSKSMEWIAEHYSVDMLLLWAIRQQERATEKRIAVRLSRLGWKQEEIGEVIGKTRERVSQIVNNVDSNIIYNFHQEGKTIAEISSISDLDPVTVWHFLLQDKPDIDRF